MFWGGGGAAVRMLLQIIAQITLARMLGPEQYALFAIGAIVVGFSTFFSDVGIAYSLIQKTEVTDRDLRFVFTWQVILGLAVTAFVALLSEPISLFFGSDGARDVVASLSIVCLLNALTATGQNLLKRQLDFRRLQIAGITGYFAGYIVVGIPLALAGAGAWALVAAWLVQAIVTLAIVYSGVRHPLRPLLRFDGCIEMVRYGGTVLLTNITNWFIGNIERVVIARLFPGRDIGLYATGYNLLYSPVASLLGIIQPVFFSASSRIVQDRQRIAQTYVSLIALTAIVVLPLFAVISAIADTFVLALYGSQWQDAAQLVRPLALAMPAFLFWGLTTPLLWVGGAPARELGVQLPLALLWLGSSWLAARHSVNAVAWTVAALFLLRYLFVLIAALRLMPFDLARIWLALRGAIAISVLCAATAAATDAQLTQQGMAPLLRLAATGGVVMTVYLAVLTAWRGTLPAICGDLLERIALKSPTPVAIWLRRLPAAR